MHCKVFELSREPIREQDRITEDTLIDCDSFMSSVADYVQDINDPYEEVVEELVNELGSAIKYNKEDNSIIFVHKDTFLKATYEEFKELTKGVTLEKFKDWYWVYKVKECLSDESGTYIYFDYPRTIDDFVRDVVKDGDKFYIGGIVDYHC